MLYESKLSQGKEYFEKALKLAQLDSDIYHYLSVVLANLDVVSKIAQKSSELDSASTAKSQPLLRTLASH